MKKKIWFLVLVLFVILLASCSKSPQEKIVGEWNYEATAKQDNDVIEEGKGILTFDSDGNMINDADPDQGLKWEIKGEEDPYQLNVYEDEELELTWELTFTSMNQVEMKIEDKDDNISVKYILIRIE